MLRRTALGEHLRLLALCLFCMLHFCTACTLLVRAKPTRQNESARSVRFAFLACCFFFFPCVLLKAPQPSPERAPDKVLKRPPTKSRKGPRPSPEKAPDQVPKGPPTKSRKGPRPCESTPIKPCESTPNSNLNEAKPCQIQLLLPEIFRNSRH